MSTYKRIQADSLWIDITCDAVTTIDPVWDNWLGKWDIEATITDATTGTPRVFGTLVRSATVGLFQLRIGPATTTGWAALPVGNYFLTIEINNTTVDYKHEEQHKIVIMAQGI